MSETGQKATLGTGNATSVVPPGPDIAGQAGHVGFVPTCDIARERRGSVEGHADPLLLTPYDVTGNVRAVSLKDKVEMLWDVVLGNIERRPRNGNVAD
jgi:hypothetical protein